MTKRMTNKTIKNCSSLASARDLVNFFFFSSSMWFSPSSHSDHFRKVDGFWLVVVSQIFFKGEFSGCCLKGAMWLSANIWQVFKSIMQTDEGVSQSVNE